MTARILLRSRALTRVPPPSGVAGRGNHTACSLKRKLSSALELEMGAWRDAEFISLRAYNGNARRSLSQCNGAAGAGNRPLPLLAFAAILLLHGAR